MGKLGMILWLGAGLLVVGLALAVGMAHWSYRQRMDEAAAAWRSIAAGAIPVGATYRPDMVADLPEIAQRYFGHAIAPGTPLSTTVELTQAGAFRLGDKQQPQGFAMSARQILNPPDAFAWLPQMQSGVMQISGLDGLAGQGAWTRFWIFGLVPVAQSSASAGLDRSARARAAIEAIWAPASLLPANGATRPMALSAWSPASAFSPPR